MKRETVYLVFAIAGTIVPWVFFGSYFALNGFDLVGFVKSVFANGAAGGFSADVLISIVVFIYGVWHDARRHKIHNWWLIFPALFFVGLSLALPLYLYFKEKSRGIEYGSRNRERKNR